MIYFLFSIAGLAVGLMIGAYRTKWVYGLCVKAFADMLLEGYNPKQTRDKSGKFVSRKELMTKQLKMELGLE